MSSGKKVTEEVQRLTDKTIQEGGLLAMFYLDVHGDSEESVKNQAAELAQKVGQTPGVVTALADIDPEILNENGLFTTSVEVKVLAKDFQTLVTIALFYGPVSAEILRPESVKLDLGQSQVLLTSIATAAHQFSVTILNQLLKAEQAEQFKKKMKAREKVGARLRKGKK